MVALLGKMRQEVRFKKDSVSLNSKVGGRAWAVGSVGSVSAKLGAQARQTGGVGGRSQRPDDVAAVAEMAVTSVKKMYSYK